MQSDFAQIMAFTRKVYAGKIEEGGSPTIEHVEWVVAETERLLRALNNPVITEEVVNCGKCVAALHDMPEDANETLVTHEDLERLWIDPSILWRVRRLDGKFRKGSYQEDKEAMADEGDIIVITVKLADNGHNGSPERIAKLPLEKRQIARRYHRARVPLQAAYDSMKREIAA